MTATATPFRFDNSYARLPERFRVRLDPVPVEQPRLLRFNHALAEELGIDAGALGPDGGAGLFAGNRVPEGAQPMALAYAGHQFGHFVPQLGDGRAHLLGEVVDRAGRRRDIQLKGSGPTPFSRRGDGRAALGPVLREYLVSEAMHALGIPTTRSLAAATTGEPVYRETVLPGAVLTRVASSHIRVGTFQYFAAQGDEDGVRTLADHAIARHYPELRGEPYLALLDAVAERQARLVAEWMRVGFVHGVMNTDNMAISGETIDYGPCAFMDAYDPDTVFSSIDHGGRYAFSNQPLAAQWNLARFAEAILPLIDDDPDRAVERARDAVSGFTARFGRHWLASLRAKLGLAAEEEGDRALADRLLALMHAAGADWTLTFRRLADVAETGDPAAAGAPLAEREDWAAWAAEWMARLAREPAGAADRAAAMRLASPAVIPRNHRVEEALAAAAEGDLGPFDRLHDALSRPCDRSAEASPLAAPPGPEQRVYRTFCGT